MRRPVPPTIRTQTLPAPLGGLNTVDPASSMPPTDCAYAWNLIPGEMGLEARLGYSEWCTGLTGGLSDEVRTLLPFAGSAQNGTTDKLFAVTSSGIWDVSASSASPTQVFAFTTSVGDSGYGVGKVVVTAGGHFLLYCDEVHGLHIYTESTDAWAAAVHGSGAGEIDNVDPADLVSLATFKGRVWFVERDSTKVWYLPAGQIFGAAVEFQLGGQFPHGGTTVGLTNWTYDGGNGMDDSLVGLSTGGDLVIYQGTDPADISTFGLKGVWYVGDTLSGRRVFTDYGGDVLILSRLGLLPLSQLVLGKSAADQGLYATAKISNLFVARAAQFGASPGWGIYIHPSNNSLVVATPASTGAAVQQFVMSFATRSWWPHRGLPMLSAATWNGELYFGTADGRVCRNVGYVDNVQLSDSNSWSPVEWSVLPAFQDLGRPTQKQIVSVRPTILAGNANASVQATARYGYDMSEPTAPSGNGGGGSSAWDIAVWDSATWQPDLVPSQAILGVSGMGREVSIALQGNAISRTVLVGVDVFFTEGGPL